MQVGVAGKKYGLQRPAGLSMFKNDDEDGGDVNKMIEAANKRRANKQSQQDAKLLAEDPTVYDYDGVYDAMQQSRKAAAPQKDTSRKPKYINGLMEKAAIRKRESDIVYDRLLQKERETEGNMYAGKEKFLTSAYKKKLQEDKLWQEEEDRRAALEEDVTKKEDLGSFYVNLLTKNEAYGGGRRPSPVPQGSKKEDKPKEEIKKKDDGQSESSRDSQQSSNDKNGTRENVDKVREDEDGRRGDSGRSSDDKHMDSDAGRGGRDGKSSGDNSKDAANTSEKTQDLDKESRKREHPEDEEGGKQPAKLPKESAREVKETKPAARRDEASIKAARERYLQRKAQQR